MGVKTKAIEPISVDGIKIRGNAMPKTLPKSEVASEGEMPKKSNLAGNITATSVFISEVDVLIAVIGAEDRISGEISPNGLESFPPFAKKIIIDIVKEKRYEIKTA